jgi:hypothetical protein
LAEFAAFLIDISNDIHVNATVSRFLSFTMLFTRGNAGKAARASDSAAPVSR